MCAIHQRIGVSTAESANGLSGFAFKTVKEEHIRGIKQIQSVLEGTHCGFGIEKSKDDLENCRCAVNSNDSEMIIALGFDKVAGEHLLKVLASDEHGLVGGIENRFALDDGFRISSWANGPFRTSSSESAPPTGAISRGTSPK
ncbi:hypothetical protein HG531_010183 [Fusarium graminearum]|nr:hypothetical protein HG531_010183 [Fusarium graminearum]